MTSQEVRPHDAAVRTARNGMVEIPRGWLQDGIGRVDVDEGPVREVDVRCFAIDRRTDGRAVRALCRGHRIPRCCRRAAQLDRRPRPESSWPRRCAAAPPADSVASAAVARSAVGSAAGIPGTRGGSCYMPDCSPSASDATTWDRPGVDRHRARPRVRPPASAASRSPDGRRLTTVRQQEAPSPGPTTRRPAEWIGWTRSSDWPRIETTARPPVLITGRRRR